VSTLADRYSLGNLRDRTLSELVAAYFADGYAAFDRLCRAAYDQILPEWSAPIIPWEEVVSECSRMPDLLIDAAESFPRRLADTFFPAE
jgi:hypothetical protein